MDAKQLLQLMCTRRDVSMHIGICLLPLLEQALVAEQSVRDRLLVLIDGALARGQHDPGHDLLEVVQQGLDEDVLKTLARTLHTWNPTPEALLTLDIPQEFMPRGLLGEQAEDPGEDAA